MANFTLNWISNITSNVTGQRAYYKQKTIPGSFLTTGFTPANDLPISANTTSISGLLNNVVYQFQVANLCTTGGPSFNNNGIQEGIKFACNNFAEAHTDTTISGTFTNLPIDIVKVIFNLDNNQQIVVSSLGTATYTFIGLTPNTQYNLTAELVAIVNGVEVTSQFSLFNGCRYIITTNSQNNCPAPKNLTVTNV